MTGHSHSEPSATGPTIRLRASAIRTIGERLLKGGIVLSYAALTGLLAILAGVGSVYAGGILPTTFGTVLVRWLTAVVAIAAAPTIARWLLRRMIGSLDR